MRLSAIRFCGFRMELGRVLIGFSLIDLVLIEGKMVNHNLVVLTVFRWNRNLTKSCLLPNQTKNIYIVISIQQEPKFIHRCLIYRVSTKEGTETKWL